RTGAAHGDAHAGELAAGETEAAAAEASAAAHAAEAAGATEAARTAAAEGATAGDAARPAEAAGGEQAELVVDADRASDPPNARRWRIRHEVGGVREQAGGPNEPTAESEAADAAEITATCPLRCGKARKGQDCHERQDGADFECLLAHGTPPH